MSDDYKKVDVDSMGGNFRKITNPIYVPDPEKLNLDQVPTLKRMLDKLHFSMLEQETELDITKQQIIAINCAISALEKVKLEDPPDDKPDRKKDIPYGLG
jgi:hypothetical protein|tara:strand:- start:99 stop:398 length:300 start_codon:yes stop_codon:yes gene_type:complete